MPRAAVRPTARSAPRSKNKPSRSSPSPNTPALGRRWRRSISSSGHGIRVGRETLRGWMTAAGLWKPQRRKARRPHLWRPRCSRRGELLQWDTSEHDWLEGRGDEKLYLIGMIDDATSELLARFVPHDSSEENRRLLRTYLEQNGRPVAVYTDRASPCLRARLRLRIGQRNRALVVIAVEPEDGGCGGATTGRLAHELDHPRRSAGARNGVTGSAVGQWASSDVTCSPTPSGGKTLLRRPIRLGTSRRSRNDSRPLALDLGHSGTGRVLKALRRRKRSSLRPEERTSLPQHLLRWRRLV